MNKPILYGHIVSPPVRACLLTAAAIDLDLEFREVKLLEKEHFTAGYLKKNPLHTIPTLEVDGKFLCDSHAIIAYLVGKYAKNDSLYPKDLLQRAMVDQKLHFDSNNLFPRVNALTAPIFKREMSIIPENLANALAEACNFLEKFLSETDYVAGNKMTIADFSCVTSVLAVLIPLPDEKYPKIKAWLKRMESLSYYAEKCGNGGKILIEHVQKILNESQQKASN